MSNDGILKRKSFLFAIRAVKLSEFLRKKHKAHDFASQVFRSGTAIGALIREAEFAESRKDFIHKLHIALKESNETSYWLELALAVTLITKRMYDSIQTDNMELIRLLVSSINTAKRNSRGGGNSE